MCVCVCMSVCVYKPYMECVAIHVHKIVNYCRNTVIFRSRILLQRPITINKM